MSTSVRKILAIAVIIVIVIGYIITVNGAGSVEPIKDKIKLGLDIKGGVYVVMEAQTDAVGEDLAKIMEQTQAVIEERVNQMGLSEPVVTIEGEKRIRIELPGAEDAEAAIETIGRTAQLQFAMADGTVVLDGSNVKDAGITVDQDHGGYAVQLEFDSEGATLFAEATRLALSGTVTPTIQGVDRRAIAIILDGEIISAPVVQNVIANGSCVITDSRTGGYPQEEATNLAALIRGGALPVSLEEIQTSNQTATIGEGAFHDSIVAGIIGLAIVVVIMLACYSVMGIAAVVALLLYVLIVVWVMASLGTVLTLPGIAGIILSIGMAVDANVIIFSRIKEEIGNGKSIRVAVNSGFKRALSTVLDAQITTIIAAVVLYEFGVSSVKGFAITLMIGIIASIFTAVFVTNLFLSVFAETKALGKKKFYGMNEDNTPKFRIKKELNFIKHRKKFYAVTLAVIIVGLVIGGTVGYNYGIDFTGGTMMQIDMGKQVPADEIEKALSDYELSPQIIYAGESHEQVIIRTIVALDNEARTEIVNHLQDTFGIADDSVLAVEQFGPSVGNELKENAIKAIIIAAIGMLIYIAIRFEWRFGIAALLGVVNDVLWVLAFYAIFRVTVNNPFIAGILTVVGYSINDTIVVFDRIRENLGLMKKSHTETLIDTSINQTLTRTIMTSLTTIAVMVPMLIFTSDSIRQFIVPLMVGVIVGTLSSITLCSPWYYELVQLTGGRKYKGGKAKKNSRSKGSKDAEADVDDFADEADEITEKAGIASDKVQKAAAKAEEAVEEAAEDAAEAAEDAAETAADEVKAAAEKTSGAVQKTAGAAQTARKKTKPGKKKHK